VILIDTTVLVYAVGVAHPLRDPCRTLVTAIGDGRVSATTTVEAIQEFVHVRARRRPRADAAALGRSYARLLAPLTTVDTDDLGRGLEVFEQHGGLGAFDAVLVAVVERREHLMAIVSADAAFATIPGVMHHDPATPRFLDDLGLA
jgi:uncharacterized protein